MLAGGQFEEDADAGIDFFSSFFFNSFGWERVFVKAIITEIEVQLSALVTRKRLYRTRAVALPRIDRASFPRGDVVT